MVSICLFSKFESKKKQASHKFQLFTITAIFFGFKFFNQSFLIFLIFFSSKTITIKYKKIAHPTPSSRIKRSTSAVDIKNPRSNSAALSEF